MEIRLYDEQDAASIIQYAKKLVNKTLRDVIGDEFSSQYEVTGSKGRFGNILEEYYFMYKPNSVNEPDFPSAGLELKSSPLKQLASGKLVAKERLVLNIINYSDVVYEEFETCSFYKKNNYLLLVFYSYNPELTLLDFEIMVVDDWRFTDEDLEVIKKDWLTIQNKIKAGLAHELSEGDTLYLGACTKGANAQTIRKQPFNHLVDAKQRAFSFKQGYVNHILAKLSQNYEDNYGRIFKTVPEKKAYSLEEITIEKLSAFYGNSLDEIENKTGFSRNILAKQNYRLLTNAMFGIDPKKAIEEFEKAGIIVKTVRVEENNKIIESVSFPAFTFEEVANTVWEESRLAEISESRFLFLFLKSTGNRNYFFEKATFWIIPHHDRIRIEEVYQKTKRVITTGSIVSSITSQKNGKIIRKNNFPKISDSRVCHVRPHGKDANDTYPLPEPDIVTGLKEFTKQSFWLNANYVMKNIYSQK
jgi:DNA mismatch repair protein MutH